MAVNRTAPTRPATRRPASGGLAWLLRDIRRFWPPLAILAASAAVVNLLLKVGPEPLRTILTEYLMIR